VPEVIPDDVSSIACIAMDVNARVVIRLVDDAVHFDEFDRVIMALDAQRVVWRIMGRWTEPVELRVSRNIGADVLPDLSVAFLWNEPNVCETYRESVSCEKTGAFSNRAIRVGF